MRALGTLFIAAAALFPAASLAGERIWNPWEGAGETARAGEIPIREETGVLKLSGILAIRAYQAFVSPLFRPVCRFTPSCSRYALESISLAGPVNGAIMGAERLSRCHSCASRGLYPEAGGGVLISDPAREKPVPLPLLQWFGF